MTIETELRVRLHSSMDTPEDLAAAPVDAWPAIAARGDRRRRRHQVASALVPVVLVVALVAGITMTRTADDAVLGTSGSSTSPSAEPDRVTLLRNVLPSSARVVTVQVGGVAIATNPAWFEVCAAGVETSAPPSCRGGAAHRIDGALPVDLAPRQEPGGWQQSPAPVTVTAGYDGARLELVGVVAGGVTGPQTATSVPARTSTGTTADRAALERRAAAITDDLRAAGVPDATAAVADDRSIDVSLPYADRLVTEWLGRFHAEFDLLVRAPLRPSADTGNAVGSGDVRVPVDDADVQALQALWPSPAQPVTVRAVGYALADGGPFRFCGGVPAEATPRFCGGPELVGVTAEQLGAVEESDGRRWARDIAVTASYDGSRLTAAGPVEQGATWPRDGSLTATPAPVTAGAPEAVAADACARFMALARRVDERGAISCGHSYDDEVNVGIGYADERIVRWIHDRFPGLRFEVRAAFRPVP